MAMIGPVISAIACLVAAGIDRSGPFLDHALDVLDHDNGVVDDNADRQDQGQQRHRVGGIADHQHDRERADDRHRHGDAAGSGSCAACRGTGTRQSPPG